MKNTEPYAGPFPRKRHVHTCLNCKRYRVAHPSDASSYCYKAQCTRARHVDSCQFCRPLTPSVTSQPAPIVAPVACDFAPTDVEIARWYVLISESDRQTILSALSLSQWRLAFEYGLAVSWQRLQPYARDLVRAEWHARRDTFAPPAPAPALVPVAPLDKPAGAQLDLFGGAL